MQPQNGVSSVFFRRKPSDYDLAPECVVHFCLAIGAKGEKGEKSPTQLAPLDDRRLLRLALLSYIVLLLRDDRCSGDIREQISVCLSVHVLHWLCI